MRFNSAFKGLKLFTDELGYNVIEGIE